MRAWLLAAVFLIGFAPFAACGSGTTKNNTASSLKELHDPKLAVTATPPDRLPTPLVANSAAGVGAGAAGTVPDTYVVKAGDTLGAIASQLGVTVTELAAANQITNPASIQVGQQLKVPKIALTPTPVSGAGPALSTPAPGSTSVSGGGQVPPTGGAPSGGGAIGSPAPGASAAASSAAGGPTSTYTVKAGDSACAIAIAHGVSLQELADANGMSKTAIAKLSINEPLKIPARTGHKGC
ncbi:MAG: LysM peptidoglycan-binding domain-containing protein [Dehalococcoidia bacterium]